MAPFWIGPHFEISTKKNLISRHFQNIFIYLNRLESAKTIGQKRKCTRWRHLELAAILNRPTSEILYIILYKAFSKCIHFSKSVKNCKILVPHAILNLFAILFFY
jgi:hypothetical protein